MVIIIKTAQQSNKSHHSLPEIAIDSMLTLENNKATPLSVAHTLAAV